MTDRDESIARLIDGGEPPCWLVEKVAKARATLAWTLRKESEYPSRVELRKRLKRVAEAVETVRNAMRDLGMSTLLLMGNAQFQNQNETYHGLGDLGDRVKSILAKTPAQPGPHKFFGSDGATPHQICALMVSVLWEKIRAAPPPNTNPEAQRACATLWAAAGGPSKRMRKTGRLPGDDTSTETWRDHLRDAKELATSEEARFLRRSLDQNWDATLERATLAEGQIIRMLSGVGE